MVVASSSPRCLTTAAVGSVARPALRWTRLVAAAASRCLTTDAVGFVSRLALHVTSHPLLLLSLVSVQALLKVCGSTAKFKCFKNAIVSRTAEPK